MKTFAEILSVGGHTNSLGRTQEVIDSVFKDGSKLDELFMCVFNDDSWIRMRAIDGFEKIIRINPEWIKPYLKKIFTHLTKSDQPSIQWHLAQIFILTDLTPKQEELAIKWLTTRLENTEVDWIVSVNTMKALVYFYNKKLVTKRMLKKLFTIQETHHSKTVRKKAAQFIQLL